MYLLITGKRNHQFLHTHTLGPILRSEKPHQRKICLSLESEELKPPNMVNNKKDALYWNASLSINDRLDDLLGRMTLEEKAGTLFHDMIMMGPNGSLSEGTSRFGMAGTEELVGKKGMTHFNLLGPVQDVRPIVEWHNRLQERALETRLGIPVTLSTDPRNHFTDNVGTSSRAGTLSQWPETLGFAALRSPGLVERFADIARQEYLALGLRVALHPQVDLATEPRWARIAGGFGEDADLCSELVTSYIVGFQGRELGKQSVSTMTKHFPGGGPQKEGQDPHFHFPNHREQVYPGSNRSYHIRPFISAIKAGGSQMMPYYGMPVGTDWEEVGFSFNKGIITGLLREELGFKGIICTDWGLLTDATILGQNMPARAWGAEHLSESERVLKILNAGCDQFGGESRPELVIRLVQEKKLSEARVDESVRRLLREKFILGLFDNPFVDVEKAVKVVGHEDFQKEANAAQRRSFCLLTNKSGMLPLSHDQSHARKVYVEGILPDLAAARGLHLVKEPHDADIALLRLKAPYEPRPGGFEAHFHAGSLEFSPEEKARHAKILKSVPSIVDVYLDRPAVVPELAEEAAALLANFGSSTDAFLDIVLGKAEPEGRLPFDLPSSMKAVEESREDMQYDTKDPLFKFGHGLRYAQS